MKTGTIGGKSSGLIDYAVDIASTDDKVYTPVTWNQYFSMGSRL